MKKEKRVPPGPVDLPPIAPGLTLREILKTLGMTQVDLSERMGRPVNKINEIVNGKRRITADTSLQLELVLGLPASFWMNLESQYQLAKARVKRTKSTPIL